MRPVMLVWLLLAACANDADVLPVLDDDASFRGVVHVESELVELFDDDAEAIQVHGCGVCGHPRGHGAGRSSLHGDEVI